MKFIHKKHNFFCLEIEMTTLNNIAGIYSDYRQNAKGSGEINEKSSVGSDEGSLN